ncbi:MAG: radical SAM family heme chaperone HemW [bacterium]|nr:radical SAM family heme chaperone HemW [bacterium]
MKNIGIYIHFPFCKRGCFYCHFVKGRYERGQVETYIDALAEEIRLRADNGYIVDTIYLGGGSPSLLTEPQVVKLVDCLYRNFYIREDIEFTIEANPEDVTGEKLAAFKNVGINRLSIGTQSFNGEDLRYLQRTHSAGQSVSAIETALGAGFSNISIDFIISLPTQTRKTLTENFSLLNRFDIPHVSAYLLEEVEDGDAKNERDNDLYFFTVRHLAELGYNHYEVSNFCKPGFCARHNLKYWENKNYMGLGLSASGYEKGEDYTNVEAFKEYFEKVKAGELPLAEMNPRDEGLRRIVMGLRLLEGIPAEHFRDYPAAAAFLLANGFLARKKGKIAVNPAKILLLNEILTYFN